MNRFARMTLRSIFALVILIPCAAIAEDCPEGYEERDQSCTASERAAGCQDVRLDDGTGCVYIPYEEDEVDEEEECPAGFEERDQGCSAEEREEGCRDVRLDSGKGCVSL